MNVRARDWLGSPDLAIWSVGGVVIWQQLGFGVVVFLAALLALPGDVVEAARLADHGDQASAQSERLMPGAG